MYSYSQKNRVFSAEIWLRSRPLSYVTAGWTNLNFLLLCTVLSGVVLHCKHTGCKQLFVYAHFMECVFERRTSAWKLLTMRDLEEWSHGDYEKYLRLYSVSFITAVASWFRIYDDGRICRISFDFSVRSSVGQREFFVWWCLIVIGHPFSVLSDDRPKASSKTMPPHSAIQSLLLQMRVSSPVLKVIQ